VRAQDQNAFDVARAAGASDERNHARIIRGVFLLQQFKRGGQSATSLLAPREHDVMRGSTDKARPPALRFATSTLPVCATSASHSEMPASHVSSS